MEQFGKGPLKESKMCIGPQPIIHVHSVKTNFSVLQYEMLTGNLPFHCSSRQETMNQILKAKLGMPDNLSSEAQSLLRALFKRNPQNRLGAGPNGIEDIKCHEFFATIDWPNLVEKRVRPPFIPAVSRDDAFYFDVEYTSKSPKDSPGGPVSASAHEIFRGFSFIAPGLLEDANVTSIRMPFSNDIPGVKPGVFQDEYNVMQELGRGTFSVCRLCESKTTRKQYAVKIINKSNHDCREEVEILLRKILFCADGNEFCGKNFISGNVYRIRQSSQHCYTLWSSRGQPLCILSDGVVARWRITRPNISYP